MIFLLGFWESHADYQRRVAAELSAIACYNPDALYEYERSISKVYILNLDLLKPLIAPCYSPIGRLSKNQPEIFRALIIMNDLKLSPGIASYYDFINRIYRMEETSRYKLKRKKPKKKYGKEKMPPKNPGIVAKLVKQILKDRRFIIDPSF